MNKTLTIIIPSYNMEKYLERCLTSLIIDDGLMDHFEALIINDGSKDRTSEIGHQYEAKYPGTFRVVDKENGHYGSCVNAGLARAQGKYVKYWMRMIRLTSISTSIWNSYVKQMQT